VLWSRSDRGRFPDAKELKQVVRDAGAPGKSLGHGSNRSVTDACAASGSRVARNV